MNTERIEHLIASACEADQNDSDLQDLLSAVAARNDRHPDEQALTRGANFVKSYIQQTPYFIKVAMVAAEQIGLRDCMQVITTAVTSYWEQDDDMIPDNLGVVGLLDDAYCTLSSLQMVSDQYRILSGKHLFPENLSNSNQAIRKVLGDPYASDLDRFVMETLNNAQIMKALQCLAEPEKRLHLEAEHTIWSHDSIPVEPENQLQGIL